MESTYGDRLHETPVEAQDRLATIIKQTFRRRGKIIVPAFAVGRTQELLYALSGEEPIGERFPVQVCGAEAGRMRAGRRRRLGLGFVPEERLGRGAVPRMSLANNALLTGWRHGMLKWSLIDRAAGGHDD